MLVGIVGSGALGSLFAAKLGPVTDLVMLGHWPEQAAALRTAGLTLISPDGRLSQHVVRFFSDASQLPALDVALVLVKAGQTRSAALELAGALKPEGVAVSLQNGLGSVEVLAEVLGQERATQGVTAQGATMMRPGFVRHAGTGSTHLPKGGARADLLERLGRLMHDAGLESALTTDIQPHVWGKLAVNAGINPLTAILGVRNGFLAKDLQARDLMCSAAEEVSAVAGMMKIALPYPSAAGRAVAVAEATAENFSSMLQDVWRGAPTEIDFICGAVGRHGRAVGFATPANDEFERMVTVISRTGERPTSSKLPGLHTLLEQGKELTRDRN